MRIVFMDVCGCIFDFLFVFCAFISLTLFASASCGFYSAALLNYWVSAKLVIPPGTEEFRQRGRILKKGKPSEWMKQGFEILKRGLYKLAMVRLVIRVVQCVLLFLL